MTITTRSIPTVAVFLVGALASAIALGADINVKLSGANEVPAVTTSASGQGKITIANDGAVSGSVTTTGVAGTAAHIHIGSVGKNGPVIIPLTKNGDTYTVPVGAKLNGEQINAFKSGDLYINVHSADHKGGEIRGQLQ